MVYSVSANEIPIDSNAVICYQGSHGDKLVDRAHIVIPTLVCMRWILWGLIFMVVIIY